MKLQDIDCYYCSNKGKDCTCGWVETINAVKNMPMRSYVVLHDVKDHIQGEPKKVNKPYDKDIDRHLAEGIEWGSLFFILGFVFVGIAYWVLTHLSEIL